MFFFSPFFPIFFPIFSACKTHWFPGISPLLGAGFPTEPTTGTTTGTTRGGRSKHCWNGRAALSIARAFAQGEGRSAQLRHRTITICQGFCLEDGLPFSKWLGSPLFISHEKGVYKGNNPILRGFTNHGY